MDKNNIEQLTKLAKVFNVDNVITAKEIEQVLVGIMQIMSSFKKDNETLNKDTKQLVEVLLERVVDEHKKLNGEAEISLASSSDALISRVSTLIDSKAKTFDEKIKQAEGLIADIKAIEVKDGKNADEDKIIAEIIAQLKTEKPIELTGEQIVDKINLLELAEEYQIDAKHIKNLPSPKGGYSPTVLGNAVDLNQSARADGYAIVWDDTAKNFKFASTGGGPVTGLTGNPTEIVYIDNSGNGTGDNLFTRDSVTLETLIAANGSFAGVTTGFRTNATGTNLYWNDPNTNEEALVAVFNSTVPGQTKLTNSYEDVSNNIFMGSTMDATGFSQIWDADTTDDIQDGFIQGNNLNGVGIKGNALAHSNTSTFESASFFAGDTTAVGGNPYEASMAYVLPGGINGAFAYTVNDDGLKAEYHDIAGNIKSQILQEAIGNTISWNADTTDTIITKLEQSQDILGLGLFSGSALTWQDSATDLVTFNGLGDASGLGAGPATSILATFDTALGDSASVSTTYDTVTSSMLVAANARTGAIQANVSLSSVDSILNYRTGVVGQESTFTANAGSAYMGYQATTASDVYHAIIGDGTFKFLNDTTSAEYMSLDAVNGNTITWDANTGDTIITKLEQSQDILLLGGLSGSALTWEDTTTQVQAFIGAVDASAVGLFPGSVLMVTNNNATGASANIVTNYDNTLNVATAVANVANGDFDSGFKFDDGRMVVRYRNTTTGFESAFESDINGAMSRYKLNTATDEYSTQLSNGVFQFINGTNSTRFLDLDVLNGLYQMGDLDGVGSSTYLSIDDAGQEIDAITELFAVTNSTFTNTAIEANTTTLGVRIGDIAGAANGTVVTVNDTAQTVYVTANSGLLVEATSGGNQWLNVAPAAGVVQLGDLSGGNGTLEVNSTGTGSINVTRPLKLQGYTQATLPTGVVGQTAYITDALTPVFGATAVGGGAVTVPVFFDGATWIVG